MVLRCGARDLIQQAVEAELAALLETYKKETTRDDRARLVRYGHLSERGVMTEIGPVAVKVPQVRDRGEASDIDGGFPSHYSQPVRSLPPLHLIWGSADQTFPVSIGRKLQQTAQQLGGPVDLDIYEGGRHDFFLRSGTRNASSAHQSAADFMRLYLSR